MKKKKKFLAALSAAAMAASMGSIPASASVVEVNVDKILCSVRQYTDYDNFNTAVYEYFEFAIDENGNPVHTNAHKPWHAIVKMADGVELEADESRYKIEKLSKYQIKRMQQLKGRYNNSAFKDIDFNVIDDYYVVDFSTGDPYDVVKNAVKTKQFCKEILESGKADYAKPIIGELKCYGPSGPGAVIEPLEEIGVDSSGFAKNLIAFTLTFNSAEDAQNFKPESVEDFAENLYVSRIKDNVMYFQIKSEHNADYYIALSDAAWADNDLALVQRIDEECDESQRADYKHLAKVLNNLQNSEAVINSGAELSYISVAWMESIAGTAGFGIPEDDHVLGDTNDDNVVDLQDAVNIAKHIIGKKDFDETQQFLADYNCNDKVDLQDAVGIAKYMLKNNKK